MKGSKTLCTCAKRRKKNSQFILNSATLFELSNQEELRLLNDQYCQTVYTKKGLSKNIREYSTQYIFTLGQSGVGFNA